MVNPFFNAKLSLNDTNLFDSLNKEMINNFGFDVVYMRRSVVQFDPVLNEPLSSSFDESQEIEMYVSQSDTYYPDAMSMSKFGFTFGGGNIVLEVSRGKFDDDVGGTPDEGDLLYIKHVSQLLEITAVNAGDPYLQGGQQFTYSLYCMPYQYNAAQDNFMDNVMRDAPSMEGIIEDFVDKMDQDSYLSQNADASATYITADYSHPDVPAFVLLTADTMTTGVQTLVTADNTATTADAMTLTADDTRSADDQLVKDQALVREMDVRLESQSDNKELICDTKRHIPDDTDPFGFS